MSNLDKIIKELEAEYHGCHLTPLQTTTNTLERFRTKIFAFDVRTGGGIPLHRVVEFHGAKSCGKTTQAFNCIGQYLRKYRDYQVLFVDFEGTYDPIWALNFIDFEDFERLHILQPAYGEEGVDIIAKAIAAENVGMLVVDSLAMMIPTKEVDASAADSFVGLQAKLTNNLLRKLYIGIIHKRRQGVPFCCILINQVRVKIGARAFATPYEKPCGIMQDHMASLDIRFYNMGYTEEKKIPVAVKHRFTIEKSKITGALPKRSGEYTLGLVQTNEFTPGKPDDYQAVLQYAKRTGVVYKEGGSWRIGETLSFKNQPEIIEFFRQEPVIFNQVYEATLEACLANVLQTSPEGQGGSDADSVQDM